MSLQLLLWLRDFAVTMRKQNLLGLSVRGAIVLTVEGAVWKTGDGGEDCTSRRSVLLASPVLMTSFALCRVVMDGS